jgi:hypothetical protein
MDFYSATSYRRDDPLKWIQTYGLTIVIVYQDELVRQKQIESLRKSGSLPSRIGFPQHVENIKYSVINFYGPTAGFVHSIDYFEPRSCVSAEEEADAKTNLLDYWGVQVWKMRGLHGSKLEPNWVTGFESPGYIISAKENSSYVKMHNVMVEKVKKYLQSQGG